MEPQRVFHAPVWGDPKAMSLALKEVRKAFGSEDTVRPNYDVLQRALKGFAQTQTVANFNELKYVCYGVSVPIADAGWRLIDSPPLFQRVLNLVDARQSQAKQYRRCYQGLLNAYLCFDKLAPSVPQSSSNWSKLGSFLDERLLDIRKASRTRGEPPNWLELLFKNRNLLGADPCKPYARSLMAGDQGPLRSVCEGLGIPDSSWVWNEALLAYIALLCDSSDRAFRDGLDGALSLVNGRTQLRMPETIARQATAMTTVRYSRCADRPEHIELRDTAVQRVGSPWLARAAWDAHVGNEPARQMVEGWLKRRLIKDFFELLAQDGGADVRRLNYWLKWEPKITDMWFVLGADARRNPTAPFKALRERMEGRRRVLDEPDGTNNAFVMRIGPLVVIEFGQTGNACYVFAASDFNTDLEAEVFTLNGRNPLKQKINASRLSHQGSWESKFDFDLARLLQRTPPTKGDLYKARAPEVAPYRATSGLREPMVVRPQVTQPPVGMNRSSALAPNIVFQIKSYCVPLGIRFEDKRDRSGGSFWVYITNRDLHRTFVRALEVHGFVFAEGKGFWFKDKN
ncbi:EH signature domain-containing protein [Inhella crocodyli]|nr:EH signature domain-containing protein [Inhella crocodyli]